jgi:predicted ATPase
MANLDTGVSVLLNRAIPPLGSRLRPRSVNESAPCTTANLETSISGYYEATKGSRSGSFEIILVLSKVAMKIEKLTFHNHVTGWQLTPTEFDSINLLVGVSGVGKTQILEAIRSLQKIIFWSIYNYIYILNGAEWDVVFSTSADSQYHWSGKFSVVEKDTYPVQEIDNSMDGRRPPMEKEELYLNGKLLVKRDKNSMIFNKNKMPKSSPSESLISILRFEDEITPLYQAWQLIVDSHAQKSERFIGSSMPDPTADLSLIDIRNQNITLVDRLALIQINHQQVFSEIKAGFIGIFPQVQDYEISKMDSRSQWSETASPIFSLNLKERAVDRWISQSMISMGMLKTLAHITEIHLLPEGSILLIDEFENSLGVNCIDVISELINKRQDVQFILTSHHPYIINKIPMKHWKIITRKGSLVTAHKATDYEELSGSKHKAFTQLINLPDYIEGIQAG